VVALMLAQRFPEASITAIEIDADAAAQAAENVAAGPFAHQISIVEGDIRQWFPEWRFDWIVTNPPFHLEDMSAPTLQRHQARQAHQLPPDLLAVQVHRLLAPDGTFSLIAPEAYVKEIAAAMMMVGIWRWQHINVYVGDGKPLLRQLVNFSSCSSGLASSDIHIHDANGQYSEAFRALTADYYLTGA
jgi:tRNA1Val (adenine37-N6)-methyltransferase